MRFQQNIFWGIIMLLFPIWAAEAQCTLTATASGFNASYTQIYVLTDASGQIVAENNTGSFANVLPGVYHIHALNYNATDAPSPLPASLIGQSINLVGSTQAGCYNNDFLSDYVVRVCDACFRTTTQCFSDALVVNSSGSMAGFQQVYVLVNAATGLVETTNTTGVFTGQVAAGNSYQVYALNHSPSDPPNPLPTPGQAITNIGTIDAGCYNSDFLTDYLCFNITTCSPPCAKQIEVCPSTDNIVATASGSNASYTQVYVLADESGNFIAQNNTGVFSAVGFPNGANYRVHALNFNPSDAPSVLPSALAAGTPLSSINDGCYNSDFLSDYVCVHIDCPIIMADDDLEFDGQEQSADNLLYWDKAQEVPTAYYTLERSTDAVHFQAIYSCMAGAHHYSFLDKNPSALTYYRVQTLYADQSYRYSKVIALTHENQWESNFVLYPNPSDGLVNLVFNADNEQDISVVVYDVLGRTLQQTQGTCLAGSNHLELELSDYSAGVYWVGLRLGTQTQLLRKLIKK